MVLSSNQNAWNWKQLIGALLLATPGSETDQWLDIRKTTVMGYSLMREARCALEVAKSSGDDENLWLVAYSKAQKFDLCTQNMLKKRWSNERINSILINQIFIGVEVKLLLLFLNLEKFSDFLFVLHMADYFVVRYLELITKEPLYSDELIIDLELKKEIDKFVMEQLRRHIADKIMPNLLDEIEDGIEQQIAQDLGCKRRKGIVY